MSMNEMSIRAFSDALASKASVPGGGGAAALVAALGAALGGMIANYTLDKDGYEQVAEELRKLLAEVEAMRLELLDCVDGDAACFAPLAEAYRLPPDAPGREEKMERCLREAARIPMRVLELSCRGILLQKELAEVGSQRLLSDAGTGVIFFWAAMYGAALNVKVNTQPMTDRDYAEAMNARVNALMQEHWTIADELYESVFGRLS